MYPKSNSFISSLTFNNGLAIGIACAILLGMVALAVFIFIKIGIKLSPLQYLEQEPLKQNMV